MRRLGFCVLLILPLLYAGAAFAACPVPLPQNTICVEWQAPTQNVDGTPLTDLAGFELFWGFTAGDFDQSRKIDIPDPVQVELQQPTSSISIPTPPAGGDVDVFFVMTAYDAGGNVSAFSNQVAKVVTFLDVDPNAPLIILIELRTT